MFFSDVIPQEAKELGNMGVTGLMSLGLFFLAGAMIWVVRTWRSDLKETQAKHDAERKEQRDKHDQEKREQRAEYTAALKEITAALQEVGREARQNALALSQMAAESKANTSAILGRLDRLEMHLPVER